MMEYNGQSVILDIMQHGNLWMKTMCSEVRALVKFLLPSRNSSNTIILLPPSPHLGNSVPLQILNCFNSYAKAVIVTYQPTNCHTK